MAHIGKIGEFNENTESFANYVERFEQFFMANEVKDEKKVAVFLSIIDPTTYSIEKFSTTGFTKRKTVQGLVESFIGALYA